MKKRGHIASGMDLQCAEQAVCEKSLDIPCTFMILLLQQNTEADFIPERERSDFMVRGKDPEGKDI